jgi:hemerythrin-like domain-containing protein
MTRHPSLVSLSHDHHDVLVMCKRIAASAGDDAALSQLCEFVLQRFSTEIEPHFDHEERHIFPCMRGVHDAQVHRAVSEHATLRGLTTRIADGDGDALLRFGELLMEHVRFEERELYPLSEAMMDEP